MKDLRLRAEKRPEDVAYELKVAVSTVRNWDAMNTAPRMTPKDMKALMNCYGCTLEELVEAQLRLEAQS